MFISFVSRITTTGQQLLPNCSHTPFSQATGGIGERVFLRYEGLDTSKFSYEVSISAGGQILMILRILEDLWGFAGIPRDS